MGNECLDMPWWMCGHTRKDRIRNEVIRDRVGVAPEAPVSSGILKGRENSKILGEAG